MTDNSYARSSFYGLNTGTPAKQLDFDNRFIAAGEMLVEANEAADAAKNSAGEAAGTLATLNATANAATTEIHATRDSAVASINATEVQATQAIDALKAQADAAKTGAEQARDLSKQWATAAEGVEVEPGLASAKAGAAVATRKATEAAASADSALQNKQAAELAKTDAQTARDLAQTARNDAQTARTDAQTAKTGADTAKAGAVQAKTDAEAARDLAQQAAATAVAGAIPMGQKGAAGGVATLDGAGKVPSTQLPTTAATLDGTGHLTSSQVPTDVARLDSNGKLQAAQVPAIAITSVYSCTTLAARDSLTVEEGDVAIVDNDGLGNPRTYIWGGYAWKELKSPLDAVTSVAGRTGAIVLAVADVTGLQALLDAKAALAGATFTGPARSKVQALTYAATVTPDFAQANDFTVTLGGACAFANPSNLAVGQGGCIRVQNTSGGGVTPTFSGNQWKALGTAQWNTAANAVSVITYKCLVAGEVLYSVGKT